MEKPLKGAKKGRGGVAQKDKIKELASVRRGERAMKVSQRKNLRPCE